MEEHYEDNIIEISDFEKAKIAFFNRNFENFYNEINSKPYKLFLSEYRYPQHLDYSPYYVVRNLNSGFVKEFDNNKNNLMCVFRCVKQDYADLYSYTGLWIVNVNIDIVSILGSRYDDFIWTEITDTIDKNLFFGNFKKQEDTNLNIVSEEYLH